MSKLVIVESPAKAKTIGKILGRDYIIKASFGHIRDLPERSFGVDIENGFLPQYEESKARGRNLSELKQAAKNASEIYLASDPDREGEAIAWHLYEVLHKVNKKAPFKRVAFHEITRSAILKAFSMPSTVDMNLVDAQQARRVLDRIVGYMVSPLLWSRIERGISAGRVQSVALRMVCEREREIQAFKPEEYWNFRALFNARNAGEFETKLFKIDREKFQIGSETDANRVLEDVRTVRSWKVASLETQPRRKNPYPPFITSTLQQAAGSALGFSASTTMRIAQQLYEGIETPSGHLGLITYMRTDAVNIAVEAQNACRSFIAEKFGARYVPEKPNFFRSKASAQGAHEAIRPTDVTLTPESLKNSLDSYQYKLYRLIWQRFVACQMAPAEQLRTTADVAGKGSSEYTFRAVATVTTFPGFLRMYNVQEETQTAEEEDSNPDVLAKLVQDMPCILAETSGEQKFTEPPPRYSEASLIRELESNGIGRPSTYATIVNTIQERTYVTKEKGKLIPSDLGFRVNDYLVGALPVLMETGFTADMETKLDKVEEGTVQWTGMLREFYDQFAVWLREAKSAGAPEAEKAGALLEYLQGIREWNAPEKFGGRTFDDKKFFNSVQKQYDAQKPISEKQWNALMNYLVKYSDQLNNAAAFCKKHGFAEDYQEAVDRARISEEKRAAAETRRAEAMEAAPPQDDLRELLEAMAKISFNTPEKRGSRVYDDKKFFDSLHQQFKNGRILSPKQVAALLKMAEKYAGSIPDYAALVKTLGGKPAANAPAAKTDAAGESAQSAAKTPELDALFEELGKIKTWNEPVKKGRRVYDDHEFVKSVEQQYKSGKVLSDRQIAAIKKTAAKYGINA